MSSVPTTLAPEKPLSTRAARGRICLVTSAPISCNPRLVKEADALVAAGYAVRVVASQHASWIVPWDAELAASRPWRHVPVRWDGVGWRSRWRRLLSGLRQAACRRLAQLGPRGAAIPELAYCRLFPELVREVTREPCDLVIAHNPQALPVAATAARRLGVPVAFDAEDDHVGEFPFGHEGAFPARLLRYLEAKYLPRCAYVTAASPGIAEALAQRYAIPTPTPIYNVFPWQDRQSLDGLVKDRKGAKVSLYWYSQIIGLDRGLQDLIRAAGRLRGDCELHLRGKPAPDSLRVLRSLAQECGVLERLYFHEQVHPRELLSRTAEHDVGFALEQPVSPNRLRTATNKIFFYMLAGLAVAASDTPGQRSVLQESPEVGGLYPPGDWQALAVLLQRWLNYPDALQRSRQAALEAARTRWNWESESRTLLTLVERVAAQRSPV